VPRVERSAEVSWDGNLARGEGRISAPSGAFSELPYSAATRVAARAETTSPEELLAAAHAGCFAMSLAGELREAEARIDVTANVVLDEVDGQGHQIVESQLEVRARAPGLAEAAFDEAVRAADRGCPFSRLISVGAKVTIDARLEEA
jgi:osmotically inducible protein OsmC